MRRPLLTRILLHAAVLLPVACAPILAQVPAPALVGYAHNWRSAEAPFLRLTDIDTAYTVVNVAFAVPAWPTAYRMEFTPDGIAADDFIRQIDTLHRRGAVVNISVGGATAPVALRTVAERDTFVRTMRDIIDTYGFDGMDLDLEGSSLTVGGGSIAAPVDQPILLLIDAVRELMRGHAARHGRRMFLSLAPETAFVQGGISAYGGIWGAYLPVIDALRDSIEILHVQLYNSGTMPGLDGGIYAQGTADFIVAMTEAVIQGFPTNGGFFHGLPARRVAVGLPACASAAGGGYAPSVTVRAALQYLLGKGPQPGGYALRDPGGYPDLRGLMTWSVNWDAAPSCAPAYGFARVFETLFGGSPTSVEPVPDASAALSVFPDPVDAGGAVTVRSARPLTGITVFDALGRRLFNRRFPPALEFPLPATPARRGVYFLLLEGVDGKRSAVKFTTR